MEKKKKKKKKKKQKNIRLYWGCSKVMLKIISTKILPYLGMYVKYDTKLLYHLERNISLSFVVFFFVFFFCFYENKSYADLFYL